MTRPTIAAVICLFFSGAAPSQSITLEQIMADPDWIGREPQQSYWADDSRSVYFIQKRAGVEQTDLYEVDLDGDNLRQVEPEEMARIDVADRTLSPNRRLKAYARAGDIFVKNLRSGDISQLTRTAAAESDPVFSADSRRVIFTRDNTVFVRDLETGLEYQPADLRMAESPSEEEEKDFLTEQQLRLFDIIRLQEERKDREENFANEQQAQDSSRVALPYYLGENTEIIAASLSPKEGWLIIALRDSTEEDAGKAGSMPNYVTASGYIESSEVRTRVGTTDFADQELYLFNLDAHQYAQLDLSELPGRQDDPLTELLVNVSEQVDSQSDKPEEKGPREIQFTGMRWSPDGNRVLFQAISRDNKDRWLLSLDIQNLQFTRDEKGADEQDDQDASRMDKLGFASPHINLVYHDHDPAWINRQFISADWLPDNRSIYFLSEADGYGHLYLHSENSTRQLTKGNYEVRDLTVSEDGEQIYFRANRQDPTIYEINRLTLDSGQIQQLTEMGGMNDYRLSPDESKLLVIHSEARQPPELYIQNARPGADAKRITDTISAAFKAVDWSTPEYVAVPSSYTDAPIHSRVYTPQATSISRPAIVFIHGAGYLQNAHRGWSGYFREFMFHSFLVQQGFVVLDMDYRASSGYGRDWRTAIYQQMGTPEVQDLADGVNWLVANRNVDRNKVCTYGGSYGGFLTLMALFNAPDLFACGAALRPVTDWAAYNHGYTSNILNIPQIDPSAYQRSSPIEFAEGLNKPLLIAHGMQDDNVFFQDSVRLVQRLIELEKENWELAIYPIEAHGFREPSSWLDEYRRIYKLFQETLQ